MMRREDIDQAFKDSLVLYKGKPAFCYGTYDDDEHIRIMDLTTRNVKIAVFKMAYVSPPPGRIGYVNTPYGCIYVSRRPIRQWKIGLSRGCAYLDSTLFGINDEEARMIMAEMTICRSSYLAPALAGDYPSFTQALEQSTKTGKAVAFDRMLAIYRGKIYYRATVVGKIVDKKPVFDKAYAYLSAHLEGNYCESLRTLRV
jgi:hypothetical protein